MANEGRPETIRTHLDKLAELAPEARARIESALKNHIETELASGAAAGGKAGREFSRGIIFSRSRGRLQDIEHSQIVNELKGMDEATFTKFASRLAAIKNVKEGGS
jgi:hypothetical protein